VEIVIPMKMLPKLQQYVKFPCEHKFIPTCNFFACVSFVDLLDFDLLEVAEVDVLRRWRSHVRLHRTVVMQDVFCLKGIHFDFEDEMRCGVTTEDRFFDNARLAGYTACFYMIFLKAYCVASEHYKCLFETLSHCVNVANE